MVGAFDPRRELILDPPAPVSGGRPGFRGESRIVERRADRIRLEVEADGPGYVDVVEGYDKGWKAEVDGRPAPLLRANLLFRAVPIPAGRHGVELRYRPAAIPIGLGLSLVSWVSAFVLLRRPGGLP
jgi:uncharacterized membrane protein YfhO